MPSLTIDGQNVHVKEEATVLKAAREAGIDIPALCHHDALAPFGSCRLCVVEIKKEGRSFIEASCTYPAEEGLEVQTSSPRVTKLRATLLELMLARFPGAEPLVQLAEEMGLQENRMPVKEAEGKKCILCGRCVRTCREVIEKKAISFCHRGTQREVASPFHEHSEDCIGCTACVFVCPTGHVYLEQKDGRTLIQPWNTEVALLECSECGAAFVPLKTLEHPRVREALVEQKESLCPACRQKAAARTLTRSIQPGARVIIK